MTAPQLPPNTNPVGWRYQHVTAMIVAFFSVVAVIGGIVFGILNLSKGDGHTTNSSSTSTAIASTSTSLNLGTPVSSSISPTTRLTSIAGKVLGLDILPNSQDTCHQPGLASGSAWEVGKIGVGGKSYTEGYFCNLFSGGSGSLDFVLAKSYSRFSVTIGFSDDEGVASLQDAVKFEIVADDKTYLSSPQIVHFGDVFPLLIDVMNVTRLELRVTDTSSPGTAAAPSKPVWALPTVMP